MRLITRQTEIFILWCSIGTLVHSFPESQNPFSAGPPIPRINPSDSCRISLFQNVSLNAYSTLSKFPYSPTPCNVEDTAYDQVVVEVKGSVAGVQYDRAGALWMGGVELLRMTTPEPTKGGITWKVQRDVTSYSSLFQRQSEVQVQIPNNVNSVYTGVIFLSAELVFYKSNVTSRNVAADYISSLSNPTQHKDAWAAMAIGGNRSMSVNITTLQLANASRAHIDLYASAHACEEFWYTNPPDSISQQYGMCGGGSTRQIQVSIDGRVAGSQPPFPVVYTGGINPLLWRPQTGIYSFNIPPYSFDITPFLGILGDGKSHEVSVSILGDNIKGVWNVDPVLVVFRDSAANSRRFNGTLNRYHFSQQGPKTTITNTSATVNGTQVNNITWVEEYESELVIETALSGGEMAKVSSTSVSFITNSLIGDTLQVTSVDMKGSMSSSTYDRFDQIRYPLKVSTDFKDSADSFRIEALVEQGIHHNLQSYSQEGDSIRYEDQIVGHATYNRSTDRTVHVQDGWSHQLASLFVGDTPCLIQAIAAEDGYVSFFDDSYKGGTCLPLSFCLRLDTCSPVVANQSAVSDDISLETYGTLDLLVRHPRIILKPQFSLVVPHKAEET